MHTTATTNTTAIISLVSGILAWTVLPVLGTIAAILCGHAALKQIRASGGFEQGEGLALAGLILGWIQVGLLVLGLVGWLLFLVLAGLVGGLTLIVLVGLGVLLFAGAAALVWMIFLGFA